MQPRREFLKLLGAAGLSGTALDIARATEGDALTERAAAFDLAARRHPWFESVRGVERDLEAPALSVRGSLPPALRGRFYRNGPARFERAGQRYAHWFDGDGMVQQFTFTGTRVSHRGRFVRTAKFGREESVGRFTRAAFGTRVPGADRVTGPDSVNTANTSAIEHAGRVLAMWEGGSAWELDPATLDSRGPIAWRADWAQMPFSAHPKLDPQGNLWNFGVFGRTLAGYHIGPDGATRKLQTAQLPVASAMVHDMAVTERYLVIPLPPLRMNPARLQAGASFIEAIEWQANEPLRWLVAPKDDITAYRVFETPPQMVFHVGNAHETAHGIELVYVSAPDDRFLTGDATAMMRGAWPPAGDDSRSQTAVVSINLNDGRAHTFAFDDTVEFPRVDPRFVGAAARFVVTPTGWRNFPGRPPHWFHGVQVRDLANGKVQRYDYGRAVIVEEHIVVARPGGAGELDGWIIGTTYDAARRRTQVNVFDARGITQGPRAVVELPYGLPLGFHGNFTPA